MNYPVIMNTKILFFGINNITTTSGGAGANASPPSRDEGTPTFPDGCYTYNFNTFLNSARTVYDEIYCNV
jgi:hypothetical protein